MTGSHVDAWETKVTYGPMALLRYGGMCTHLAADGSGTLIFTHTHTQRKRWLPHWFPLRFPCPAIFSQVLIFSFCQASKGLGFMLIVPQWHGTSHLHNAPCSFCSVWAAPFGLIQIQEADCQRRAPGCGQKSKGVDLAYGGERLWVGRARDEQTSRRYFRRSRFTCVWLPAA